MSVRKGLFVHRITLTIILVLFLSIAGCNQSAEQPSKANSPVALAAKKSEPGEGQQTADKTETFLNNSPAEIARRKWIFETTIPTQREKILKETEEQKRKDPLLAEVELLEEFSRLMRGNDSNSGLIAKYSREFGGDSPF